MDEPLNAQTLGEATYYLRVTPCPACGAGPWQPKDIAPPEPDGQITISSRCHGCGGQKAFVFRIAHTLPDTETQAEYLNPTDAPSQLIDLGQWLSLYHLFIEASESAATATMARCENFRAAACLTEALKFYRNDRDELPPPEAFFTPGSLEMFHEHPEGFARQKLQDMRARLPVLAVTADQLDHDEKPASQPWWRFWGN